jgi:hypothetical protein
VTEATGNGELDWEEEGSKESREPRVDLASSMAEGIWRR